MAVSSGGMKLPTPSKFSGKKGTLDGFLGQVELFIAIYSIAFEKPEARNLFYISYLEVNAAATSVNIL